jgi:hypothetical protein
MKKILHILAILCIMLPFLRIPAQEQPVEKGPFTTLLSFICTSTSDDSIQLKTVLTVKHENWPKMLANATVRYSIAGKDGETQVGQVKTNLHGEAILKLPATANFERDETGLIQFRASYSGDDNYEGSEGEFGIRPSKLLISFFEEDSVKFVKVEGFQYNINGTESPLSMVDVNVSVKKMFTLLKIGQVSLDSTGTATMEFPSGIIGDSLGNLKVFATVDEHETYGFIQGTADNSWGIPKHLISPDRPSRELWTPIAPLWMIITLIIMLTGVWGHYVYAIVQLVMIKKAAKHLPEKEEKTP